jgi:hypothetical protein
MLPPRIAHILHRDPQLIAPAVEAFYLRDPVGLRVCSWRRRVLHALHDGRQRCQAAKTFPTEHVIRTLVRFNRVMYAQLESQRDFHPSAAFGVSAQSSEMRKAALLGAKVVSGPAAQRVDGCRRHAGLRV